MQAGGALTVTKGILTKAAIKKLRSQDADSKVRETLSAPSVNERRGPAKVVCHDDDSAMINVCQNVWNPTMRHLGRVHGISVTFASRGS